jgi:hypothetical protein
VHAPHLPRHVTSGSAACRRARHWRLLATTPTSAQGCSGVTWAARCALMSAGRRRGAMRRRGRASLSCRRMRVSANCWRCQCGADTLAESGCCSSLSLLLMHCLSCDGKHCMPAPLAALPPHRPEPHCHEPHGSHLHRQARGRSSGGWSGAATPRCAAPAALRCTTCASGAALELLKAQTVIPLQAAQTRLLEGQQHHVCTAAVA